MKFWKVQRVAGAVAVAMCTFVFVATPLGNSASASAPLFGPGSGCDPQNPSTVGYSANLVDNTVSVIDLVNNTVIGTISGFEDPWAVNVTPDGSTLFVADAPPSNPSEDAIDVVNTCTDQIVKQIPTLGIGFQTMSPDGRRLYVVNLLTVGVRVIDTATGNTVGNYLTTVAPQGAVSADGKTLWVSAYPDLIYAINMATGLPEGLPVDLQGVAPLQFNISNDGSTLGVTDLDGDVDLINTHTRAVTTINLGIDSQPSWATFSPNGSYLWVGTYSGEVAVIDVATDQVVNTIQAGGWVTGVTISPDGTTAYVTTTPAGSTIPELGIFYAVPALLALWHPGGLVQVYNTTTYAEETTITTGNVPIGLAIP